MDSQVIKYVLDDDPICVKLLENEFKKNGITNIHSFTNSDGLKRALSENRDKRDDVVIIDYFLENETAADVIQYILNCKYSCRYIIMSSKFDVETIVNVINTFSGYGIQFYLVNKAAHDWLSNATDYVQKCSKDIMEDNETYLRIKEKPDKL